MRLIKKYANRKLYDTVDKSYITMDKLAGLIKDGEEVKIVDNKTGNDITGSVVSQLLARENKEEKREVPSGLLIQLLRRGSGTVRDYARKYASFWQSTMTMAEDEIDKLVNSLVKNRELSESEGNKLKKEIVGFSENARKWIKESVDKRVNETLDKMNLASRKQVNELTQKMEELTEKIEALEKIQTEIKTNQRSKKIDNVKPPGNS